MPGLAPNRAERRRRVFSPIEPPSRAEMLAVLDRFHAGDLAAAERMALGLARRFPRHAFGWKLAGAVCARREQWADGIGHYERAVPWVEAQDWEFANNYANALKGTGRLDEAMRWYERALGVVPDAIEPAYNLALTLIDAGRFAEAEARLVRVIERAPESAHAGMARLNLANILNVQGRLADAEAQYRGALMALDGDARLHNNYGQLLAKQKRYREAEREYRRALEIDPKYATVRSNLAELMATHGSMADAEALLREAIALEPEHAQAHSNLLFTLGHRETLLQEGAAAALLAEHLRYGERVEAPLRAAWPRHANARDPEKRLRLGFVTGDLRDHPVVRYLLPVLERLARREDVVLVAYSTNAQRDAETLRYQALFAAWREVHAVPDDALVLQVVRDGIDVLFDLAGHTGHNRLPVFARKPAPLQVSWLGYVGTTGLAAMDYAIAEEHLVPDAMAGQFTEALLRLPVTSTFEPVAQAPAVNELPVLSRGEFTYCCLARMNKLNAAVAAAWACVLRRVPGSRLVVAALPDGGEPRLLLQWLAAAGVERARVKVVHLGCVEEVLALHREVDLALDSFPYCGSTGSNHALWMGVPTITLAGMTACGRMGTSLAMHVGLEGFVARDVGEYIELAVVWSQSSDELSALRGELRGRFAVSALQQHDAFAAALVAKLRVAWRRWCEGLPAASC